MKKLVTLAALAGITLGTSLVASAEVVRLPPSNVTAVLIDKDYYGGCMAQVDINVNATAPECSGSYISFDCDGDFQDTAVGSRFLEMAQVAYVTGKGMRFSVDTNLQHNGFCVATRADLK